MNAFELLAPYLLGGGVAVVLYVLWRLSDFELLLDAAVVAVCMVIESFGGD